MTIEIHKPELEALILERMKSGAFQNVEDVLMQALKSAPPPAEGAGGPEERAHTGAELVAAMQTSPYQDIDLTPQHNRLPERALTPGMEREEADLSATWTSGKEKARAFAQWARSHRDTPPLSDEAISRASMYPDRW